MALAGVPWLDDWLANLALLSGPGGINDPGRLNDDRYTLINLQYPLNAILPAGPAADVATLLAVGLAAVATIWLNRGRPRQSDLLVVATVATLALLATYHRYYDAVLLAFPIAWAMANLDGRQRSPAIAVLILSSDLVFPVQTALHDLAARGLVPDWLATSGLWEVGLLAQHVWALVLIVATLIWAASRERSTSLEGEPAGVGRPVAETP
jgi:hypothetical protein